MLNTTPLSCPRPTCKYQNKEALPFCKRCGFDLRYGQTEKPKIGPCAFCTFTRPFSREHFFPKWLRDYYPRRSKRTNHIISRPERLEFWEESQKHYGKGKGHKMNDPYEAVVENVCEECNTGWMSRLQDEAKPIVKELADGGWPLLDANQRTILARWCIMTTMNIEYIGNIITTRQFHRTTLMQGNVPGGWLISIARVNDTKAAGFNLQRAMAIPVQWYSELESPNLRYLRTIINYV